MYPELSHPSFDGLISSLVPPPPLFRVHMGPQGWVTSPHTMGRVVDRGSSRGSHGILLADRYEIQVRQGSTFS